MKRNALILFGAFSLFATGGAAAQDLSDRPVAPPTAADIAQSDAEEEILFSADELEYDSEGDIVVARGDVRLSRAGNRLRADRVRWDRKSGQVVADGNIAVTNPEGDVAYGDRIELTDTLRDGMVENMLVVLDQGGRIAAERGTRSDGGVVTVERAAYTPCAVTSNENCPKEPSWKITAVRVVYDPARHRIRYYGARLSIFGFATLPLPAFSHPVGDFSDNGVLAPQIRLDRVNGLEIAVPYYFNLSPNRDLTLTPHLFTDSLPLLEGEYRALTDRGAYRVRGYATYSRQSDDRGPGGGLVDSDQQFRGYIDGNGRFQLDPRWSIAGTLRVATDRTFLRRYDISRDDRLRSFFNVERIDRDSYFAINGWAVQTLRLGDTQSLQPIALPEIEYRRRIADPLLGGVIRINANTLALARADGQDTQRAFASAQWDLRRVSNWGHDITLTGLVRGDLYNSDDVLTTLVESYRGRDGFQARGIALAALDVKWPFIGAALGGTQRITPRVQLVVAPRIRNFQIPNEDSRAIDLEDVNLFSLNRFPGYDRFEDSSRVTYGVEYALSLPGVAIDANVGQSYRLNNRTAILPEGTGLSDRLSDIVGRTDVRFRDFVSLTHRYRLDKDNLAVRRNEVDATVGSRKTYVLLGYLRLNRDIATTGEDLQDREEARVGARVAFAGFWSLFGSATVDLTDRNEDTLSSSDGFQPVRHRLGFAYEDDCLKLGLTWRRDYQDLGDARRGNSYLLTLELKNLGR